MRETSAPGAEQLAPEASVISVRSQHDYDEQNGDFPVLSETPPIREHRKSRTQRSSYPSQSGNNDANPASVYSIAAKASTALETGPDASHTSTAYKASLEADDGTATLRPAPTPSARRRESEAALLHEDHSERPQPKKRKRAASPPWNFPSAETTTLKTADGRRVSARFNASTPALSETDDRVHSGGLSTPASRSRAVSPPWRRFEAEGPTTLRVDGKRKSGRVNKELTGTPKRVSPRTKQKLAEVSTVQNGGNKPGRKKRMGPNSKKTEVLLEDPTNATDGQSTNSASSKTIAELQAKIAALQPIRSFPAMEDPTEHITLNSNGEQSLNAPDLERPMSPQVTRRRRRMDSADNSLEQTRPSPRIKLRLNSTRHMIPAPHPQATLRSPVRPPRLSIYQILEQVELKEMQQPFTENERNPPDAEFFEQRAEKLAVEEAAMRRRLLKEAEPGGVLSQERSSLYRDERQSEPAPQYGHQDHLVAHALYLRQLQLREKTQHRNLAKKLAYEALEKWKQRNGPTEDDIFRMVKNQVVADLKAQWTLVESHIQQIKKAAWEAEQERVQAERLQKKLEYSENLLARQRGDLNSDSDADQDSDENVESGLEEDGDEDEDEDEDPNEDEEENMSDAEDESDESEPAEVGDMSEEALAGYLEQRLAEPPDKNRGPDSGDEEVSSDDDDNDDDDNDEDTVPMASCAQQLDDAGTGFAEAGFDSRLGGSSKSTSRESSIADAMDVDHVPVTDPAQDCVTEQDDEADDNLSSDESVDMSDSDEDAGSAADDSTADEDDDDDDDDDNVDEDSGKEAGLSLLGFYGKKDLLRFRDDGLPTPVTSVENGGESEHHPSDSESRFVDQAASTARANGTEDADKQLAAEMASQQQASPKLAEEHQDQNGDDDADDEAEVRSTDDTMDTQEDPVTKALVPTPSLLRGTLRSYQHAGLNWLASLYRNGTNGLLADEMGLGKTIQTIALLAHLAEVHEVWDTHLIIVPTSVVLNWVTEFQKFLPGFRVLGYYGTAEERQQKRRGWTNDPHGEIKEKRGYNVVITSYNVAMQDYNAIRSVQWHYLILDEAHNIRNFNSQRWQVLIRLRTRARLLLTGTPLQNDLAEVWSLLTFLTAGDDESSHGALEEFLSHWKDPVKEIFDQGVQKISENAQRVVEQLHISLRPFLLRRKKSEVEKDLPRKTESIVVCKLSKRQRQLYQDYMGLAETKATLAKGSGVQAAGVLLSLRKVCNHPDLFDPRPIQTSFAMESSALESYTVKECIVRHLLQTTNTVPAKLVVSAREALRRSDVRRLQRLGASCALRKHVEEIESTPPEPNADAATFAGLRILHRLHQRERKLSHLRGLIRATHSALGDEPVYGTDLRELLTIHSDSLHRNARQTGRAFKGWLKLGNRPLLFGNYSDSILAQNTRLQQEIATNDSYAERMEDNIVRFAFVTPAVTAPLLNYAIPKPTEELLRISSAYPMETDFGHEARVRTSIAFPDSRLLIYDSGKLQRLVYLLRELQSRGSRSLIFTQMTGTLNVLEQFLNLLNLPYLRLDGSTPVERRQLYSSEFNRPDSKYQCMILSSRAGGVGLNLTGASSVIFYDLDWNPQMDRQCMDRAHRIGQVRDVEVYKMVSEKTVEENILRRADQKSLLDQTVIQEGHFTTEYQHDNHRRRPRDLADDEVDAAIERFLGGDDKTQNQTLESVEDREDVQAAQQAAKEDRQDDVDFVERSSKGPSKANTPGPGPGPESEAAEEGRAGHIDSYMIRYMHFLLRDWRYVPPQSRPDKNRRDRTQRPRKR